MSYNHYIPRRPEAVACLPAAFSAFLRPCSSIVAWRASVVEYAFGRRTEFAQASDAVRGVCCGVPCGVPCAKAPASPLSLPPMSASPPSRCPPFPPSIVVLDNRKMDAGTKKKFSKGKVSNVSALAYMYYIKLTISRTFAKRGLERWTLAPSLV
jgi:hypothetical protein